MANMVKEFSQTDGKLAVEATARDPWASAP